MSHGGLNIELFITLYIGHKVSDYLFQTEYQALNKSKNWGALLRHCTFYTLIVLGGAYIFTGFFNWTAILIIFVSHTILDDRKFLNWWGKTIKRMRDPNDSKSQVAMMELDQAFHYVVLFLISFMK